MEKNINIQQAHFFSTGWKALKQLFNVLNFSACASFPNIGIRNNNRVKWLTKWINLEKCDLIVYFLVKFHGWTWSKSVWHFQNPEFGHFFEKVT